MSKRPIAQVRLPAHHPAVADGDEGDEVQIMAHRAPAPKTDPAMNRLSEGEQPMPLEHTYHVTSIARIPKGKGTSQARPSKSAIARMKDQQTEEASEVS